MENYFSEQYLSSVDLDQFQRVLNDHAKREKNFTYAYYLALVKKTLAQEQIRRYAQ